jgi:lipopolysaccharide export system protein LptA
MKTSSDRYPRVNPLAGRCTSARTGTCVIAAIVLLCSLYAFADTGGALILEHADSNENFYESTTGEFISYLRGNVVFLLDDIRMSAEDAAWQRNAGRVNFNRNVKVEQRGQVMTCDHLYFERDKNVLIATGNVLYVDSAKITFMRGDMATYATDKKECLLRGNPLLMRIDTTETDTLFIRGKFMMYNDSIKIATVTEDVKITRGSLTATGRRAFYHVDENMAQLRINPVINYEDHKIVGDSVDLFFGKESLQGASVMGSAHGFYSEAADSSMDTTVMNIWSDSLALSMFESGKINSIKAFGNARGDYSEIPAGPKAATVTNIVSDSMHMFMFETGKVRAMKAYGNARGKYSETGADQRSAMATDISSDSMHMFMFETGRISGMKAFGKAHGRSAEWSASSSNDSTITHIWSDSLRVAMTDEGKINTMRAFGNVISKNFVVGDSARTNEVSGNRMTLVFDSSGKIERAVVRGNAKSRYFVDEADGGGSNVASGDQIIVTFTQGKAQRLRVRGNARGIYFP